MGEEVELLGPGMGPEDESRHTGMFPRHFRGSHLAIPDPSDA